MQDLQKVIEIIANSGLVMTDISFVRGVAETSSNRLVYIQEIGSLQDKLS